MRLNTVEIGNMKIGIDEDDAAEILLQNRGRVMYTVRTERDRSKDIIPVNEMVDPQSYRWDDREVEYEVFADQTMEEIHKQLKDAVVVYAIMYEGEY